MWYSFAKNKNLNIFSNFVVNSDQKFLILPKFYKRSQRREQIEDIFLGKKST